MFRDKVINLLLKIGVDYIQKGPTTWEDGAEIAELHELELVTSSHEHAPVGILENVAPTAKGKEKFIDLILEGMDQHREILKTLKISTEGTSEQEIRDQLEKAIMLNDL